LNVRAARNAVRVEGDMKVNLQKPFNFDWKSGFPTPWISLFHVITHTILR